MNRPGSPLVRATIGQLGASVAGAGSGFVFWVVAARRFDPATVASAAAVVPVIGAAAVVAAAGWVPTVQLWASRRQLPIRVFAAAVGSAAVVAVLVAMVAGRSGGGGGWVPVAAVVTAVGVVVDAVLLAAGRPGVVAVRAGVAGVVKVMVAATAAGSATVLVAAWTVGLVVAAAVTAVPTVASVRAVAGPAPGSPRRLVAVNTVAQVAAQLPAFAVPAVVVAGLDADAAAGFYAAWLLATLVWMVAPAVAAGLLVTSSTPPGSGSVGAGRVAAVLLAVAVPGTVVAAPVLLGVFGGGYIAAVPVLRWLGVSAVPVAVVAVAVARWRVRDRPGAAAVVVVTQAGVAVAAVVVVVGHGPVAVAVAWTVAQSVVAAATILARWWGARSAAGAVRADAGIVGACPHGNRTEEMSP